MSDIKIKEEIKCDIENSIDDLVRASIKAGLITEYEINRWLDLYYEVSK